jgi:hypothetical protein
MPLRRGRGWLRCGGGGGCAVGREAQPRVAKGKGGGLK